MNPLCVAFDLDDTLFLERDYVWSGFRAIEPWAKTNLGLEDFALQAWTLFKRGERGDIFDRILVSAGVGSDRHTIQTMVDLYRGHTPVIQLAPDVVDCLRGLRGQAHLALVTDGPEQSQENKIKALGLERSFEAMVLTSSLGSGYAKPHLKAFLEVQKYFGSAVQQYTYVADNPSKDFIGPRSLGWKTIRVRRDEGLYSCFEADKSASADLEMPDLTSLTNVIMEGQQQPSC